MNDLIKRLRDPNHWSSDDSLEAADTIEKLQAEVEEYHKLTAETNAARLKEQAERQKLRRLLEISLPYVESQAKAEHLLDGFRPQIRPLDKVVEEIRQALFTQETK